MRISAHAAIAALATVSAPGFSYAGSVIGQDRDTAPNHATAQMNSDDPDNWTQSRLDSLKKAHRQQEQLLQAKLNARKNGVADDPKAKQGKQKVATAAHPDDFSTFQKQYLREINYQAEADVPAPPVVPQNECDPQRLFIRSDSLDNYLYGITPASKAKGASISYTDDLQKSLQTLTVNGMVSYVIARNLCINTPANDVPFVSAYSLAPFVNAQGNFTQPEAKTEKSSLKFGTEAQVEVSQLIFPRQVFTLAPFYQTDFRGIAQIDGVSAYWDVYDANLHLGGYVSTPLEPNLGWFVQLRGEADALKVTVPGLTNLVKSNYEWVGGTARLNMFFFPLATNVPVFLQNRVSFIATVDAFHDMNSGQNITKYTAALAYKITPDGASSISLEYDKGTDKDTLNVLNQYLLKLTYAY
jgi:hypothetical protein